MNVIGSGEVLGATIEGLDLAQPLAEAEFDAMVRALGQHGVIRFPEQKLSSRQLAGFAARFGKLEVNVAGAFQDRQCPK